MRRADSAGLVCAVICRRLAGKAGPELDAEDIGYGAGFADYFCEGASELIKNVAGGHFYKRLTAYEEWVAEFMFTKGREPTARELQRHDQRNLDAAIAQRELPGLIRRASSRR